MKMQLLRDGVVMFTSPRDEAQGVYDCMQYIHQHHSYSLAHALTYEGYVMRGATSESVFGENISSSPYTSTSYADEMPEADFYGG